VSVWTASKGKQAIAWLDCQWERQVCCETPVWSVPSRRAGMAR